MGLMASSKSSYPLPPADLHNAACIGVYDMGTQTTNFGAKKQIKLVWEMSCKKEDGRPFTISKDYTPSLSEKANLRKLLESWRGKKMTDEECKEFDVSKLLGKPCRIQVLHDGEYANVGAVMPPATDAPAYTPTFPVLSYDMDRDGKDFPEAMPEFVKKKILGAAEWGIKEAAKQNGQFDAGSVEGQAQNVF